MKTFVAMPSLQDKELVPTIKEVLSKARYPQDIVVLRAVLTNLLTKSRFLKEILEEQRELGQELLENKFMNLLPK